MIHFLNGQLPLGVGLSQPAPPCVDHAEARAEATAATADGVWSST
jgi:hypothetical protein